MTAGRAWFPRVLALAGAVLSSPAGARDRGVIHAPQSDIGYETFGTSGPALPVIAVNGGPGLSHAYMLQNDMWQKVARDRLVVFYDQRGTGASRPLRPGAAQTLDAQVADLEALRAGLRLERVAIVGDSYGGMIAIAYAAAHPDHVARLVLSDAVPSWTGIVHLLPQVYPDVEEEDAAQERKLGPGTDAAARASLRDHFRMIFHAPAKRDAFLARMGNLGYEPDVADAVSGATAGVDLTPRLAGLAVPTLVIAGRHDMNVAPLTAWRMAHAIPHARIVFFEESGHLPSYEEPERYRAVLDAFLDDPSGTLAGPGGGRD